MQMQLSLLGECWRRPGTEPSRYVKFCLLLVMPILPGWAGIVAAQGLTSPPGTDSAPLLGGAGVRAPTQLPILNGSQNAAAKVHMGPMGKPCLTVQGYAQPQLVNPNIFDHMIVANNSCSQLIKIQVCYFQSHECIPAAVPGYGRKEVVLGIMPAMKQFRFEYREQFDQGIGGPGLGLN